jgi:hypothetical protein
VIESIEIQETEVIQQVFSTDSASIQQLTAETEVLNRQDVEPVSNPVEIQQTEPALGGEGGVPVAECQTELFEQRLNGDFVVVEGAQTESLNLQESADDLWMEEENLQSMADDLSGCSDKEELAELRQCWSPQAMNAACKRLTQEKHEQIKQWVIELNSQDS